MSPIVSGLEGLVDLVGLGVLGGGLGGGVEIVGVVGGRGQVRSLAHHQGAGGDRLEAGLVVVDGHGVGALDAVQQVAPGAGEQQASAVGGVDVEPGAVRAGGVGDRGERVDGAPVGGAGGRDDRHRPLPRFLERVQRLVQRRGVHAALGVGGDGQHGVGAQSEQGRGAGDGEVGGLGGEDPQAGQQGGAVLPRLALGAGAGEEEGLEVGLGTAGGEHSVAGPEADAAGGPAHEPLLHEGRDQRLVVGVHGGVDRGEHCLGGHGREHDGAVQVREIGGVVEPHGVGGVELVGLAQGRGVPHAGAVEVGGVHEALEVSTIGADGGGAHGAEPLGGVAGDLAEQLLVGVGGAGGQQRGRRRGGPVVGRGGTRRE
jgi:hypothetical protein